MEAQGARVKSDRAGAWPPFLVLLKCICSVLASLLSPLLLLTQFLMHVYTRVCHYLSFIMEVRHRATQPPAQVHRQCGATAWL